MKFEFLTVPSIVVESNGSRRLGEILHEKFGAIDRLFLVTDQILLDLGIVDEAIASLRSVGIIVETYSEVVPDPSEAIILNASARAKDFGADLVVGLGGGSSMDTAKLVAALAGSEQPISQMYGVNQITGARLPLALVPTTAGTGSEVTQLSIVTLDETSKVGVSSPALFPDLALLDATLTIGLPSAATAATGIDAMVHAVEAYTSRIHKNPISDQLALSALKALHGNIERACSDGGDLEVREAMLFGAMQAGQAFANAPVGAVHALAYPLGATFHVPHGLSNSLVLPSVLKFNASAADDLYSELAAHLGLRPTSTALIDEFIRIADATKIETRLSEVGVKQHHLEQLAEDAMKIERLLINNPREMSYDAALACYQSAL